MNLADRMKAYEACSTYALPRRTPLIVRVDGKAFHTFTRGLPAFYAPFMEAMVTAAQQTAREMQGCVLAYVQSDEVSFLLQDWATLDTEPWFGKNLAKVVSISAAMMTAYFGQAFDGRERGRVPLFDSRAFVLPEAEVANYFLWRAKDCQRNSLLMHAQQHFSHRQLHKVAAPEIHEMLHLIGRNWATDLDARSKNGTFVVRDPGGRSAYPLPPQHSWHIVSYIEPKYAPIHNLLQSILPRDPCAAATPPAQAPSATATLLP